MSLNSSSTPAPSLWHAFRLWAYIGGVSFGGPAAQIALVHKEVVDDRAWLTERQFLNALNFCMLLPGPEAMQLVTYIGWRLHGTLGGLLAGLLFVLPGALVMLALAGVYVAFGHIPVVDTLFQGVQATVVVIVLAALWRLVGKALKQRVHWVLAALAFMSLFFFNVPYPLVVVMAGIVGAVYLQNAADKHEPVVRYSLKKTAVTVLVWLLVWWLPVVGLWLSGAEILTDIAVFFSQLAVVTFGGAYAVLAYMTQDVVNLKGWLETHEMITGLGLAETTPGPLILVTEFVGFLSAFREGGWWLGLAGAVVALWVTFVPCFLWIFAGGPYLEWVSSRPRLQGALSGITAAVVGVILSLSLWFALQVFFAEVTPLVFGPLTLWQPAMSSLHVSTVLLSMASAYVLWCRQWNIIQVLLFACALAYGVSWLV